MSGQGGLLLDRLRARAEEDPEAIAVVSADGRPYSRVALLGQVAQVPRSPAGRALAVGGRSPAGLFAALMAAERDEAVPVVGEPESAAATVSVADRLLAPRPAGERRGLMVLTTSGSTGPAAAVLRRSASWDASLAPFSSLTGLGAEDVVWAPGPASSTLTLWAVWHALAVGIPVLAPGAWRGALPPRAAEVTAAHGVPAVLDRVLDARERGELPRLRLAVVAGAAVTPALRRRHADLGVRLVEYYGAAELSFVAADPDGEGLLPFPGAEVALRDGRLWVRSPYLALGYLQARSQGPLRRDAAGWASVGDRGAWTGDGRLRVLGRPGTVSVGGSLVAPAEVEAVLGAVPGVLEVVCVGEPHPAVGHRLVAAVRLVPGVERKSGVAALRRAAREHLPVPARPVRFVVLQGFPRTPSGKAARAELAAMIAVPPA